MTELRKRFTSLRRQVGRRYSSIIQTGGHTSDRREFHAIDDITGRPMNAWSDLGVFFAFLLLLGILLEAYASFIWPIPSDMYAAVREYGDKIAYGIPITAGHVLVAILVANFIGYPLGMLITLSGRWEGFLSAITYCSMSLSRIGILLFIYGAVPREIMEVPTPRVGIFLLYAGIMHSAEHGRRAAKACKYSKEVEAAIALGFLRKWQIFLLFLWPLTRSQRINIVLQTGTWAWLAMIYIEYTLVSNHGLGYLTYAAIEHYSEFPLFWVCMFVTMLCSMATALIIRKIQDFYEQKEVMQRG